MHSLETGIIISIAAFFFFSFLTFVFLRETRISNEILKKAEAEKKEYMINCENGYRPERINNVISVVIEEDIFDGGEVEE